ncbi:TPR Domain containing protein [Trichomonas vaginalis G3]|uniref:TPR Domain containing protein n=1 Tax=Trichomonas vaginalis (strain ATCC PRA-98 / G3) TaxID=412133 RepID=A2DSM9_TRIV3|nr:cellulose synthase operon protein C family [Trichomonas vaginalis G3]EAY16609.1 TPR Domain containing protein [Trichomonas vaginalis G3]KAI5532986.1 cellulose synthase operon protein C family [Trichomonas vaginalis G3]|eukprot:XP_001328832.1 TPR Domain containing protein [Trichomonas vaginalis G3]
MEAINQGRKLIKDKVRDVNTAKSLISYAKQLLTKSRAAWAPPEKGTIPYDPQSWIEELLFVAYVISTCFEQNPKQFTDENLQNQLVAILSYASVQLRQIDMISSIIDSIVQSLICPNLVIPDYILLHNHNAVHLLLNVYESEISDGVLLSACICLAKDKNFYHSVDKYLPRIEQKYPAGAASLKAVLIMQNISNSQIPEKAQEALTIINNALSKEPKNPQLLYNAAVLCLKLHNKEKACEYAIKALESNPALPYTVLLVMKLLRSNCDFKAALDLADRSPLEAGYWSKEIVIEACLVAAESGNKQKIEKYFTRLRKYWRQDPEALYATVKTSLMLNNIAYASECFTLWSEFDQQSAEFFYAYSQLCIYSNDLKEAERHLMYAIDIDGSCAEYHSTLALVLHKRGKPEMAIERAKFAIDLDPDCIHSWLVLANVSDGDVSANALKKVQDLRSTTVDMTGVELVICSGDSRGSFSIE